MIGAKRSAVQYVCGIFGCQIFWRGRRPIGRIGERLVSIGGGDFRKLWDASKPWLDGQGERGRGRLRQKCRCWTWKLDASWIGIPLP
jgi:hypothetical protein